MRKITWTQINSTDVGSIDSLRLFTVESHIDHFLLIPHFPCLNKPIRCANKADCMIIAEKLLLHFCWTVLKNHN